VSSQLNSASEHAFGPTDLKSIRVGTERLSLGSAADPVLFVTAARKNKPRWLKVHPLTLTLLGLAVAVVLWGLEYKVSLYHPHPKHSARVGVAKLWLGPRRAVFVTNSCIKRYVPPAADRHLLTTQYVSASGLNSCACCWEAELIPSTTSLSRQGAPRAPPSIQIANRCRRAPLRVVAGSTLSGKTPLVNLDMQGIR
jgi:hypothetical protein